MALLRAMEGEGSRWKQADTLMSSYGGPSLKIPISSLIRSSECQI
uniref:Uncharacterized protein n=1 Tax=Arundo donax TaxID=35708 RepID=A0A0A9GNV0_ARUDO